MIPAVTGFWRGRKKPINNIIRFRTTAEGLQSFSVQLISLPETTYFDVDWGDGSPEEAFSTNATAINIAHEFLDDAEKEVTLTFEDIEHFGGFNFGSGKQITYINIQNSLGLRYFVCDDPNLTEIVFPTAVQTSTLTHFYVRNTKLTVIDLTNIRLTDTGIGADLLLNNCSELQELIIPNDDGILYRLQATSCPLLETIDLSGYTQLRDDATGANIQIHTNNSLTSVILPTATSGNLGLFQANSCPLLETINLSGYQMLTTGAGSRVHVQSSGLKTITFRTAPDPEEILGELNAQLCDLTGEVTIPYRTYTFIYLDRNINLTEVNFTNPANDLRVNALQTYQTGIEYLHLEKFIGANTNSVLTPEFEKRRLLLNSRYCDNLKNVYLSDDFSADSSLEYRLDRCTELAGVIDFSMVAYFNGTCTIGQTVSNYTQPPIENLTAVLFSPTAKGSMGSFVLNLCPNIEYLDLSWIKSSGVYYAGGGNRMGGINLNGNSSLHTIDWFSGIDITSLQTGIYEITWQVNFNTTLIDVIDLSSNRFHGASQFSSMPNLTCLKAPQRYRDIVRDARITGYFQIAANNNPVMHTLDLSPQTSINRVEVSNCDLLTTVIKPATQDVDSLGTGLLQFISNPLLEVLDLDYDMQGIYQDGYICNIRSNVTLQELYLHALNLSNNNDLYGNDLDIFEVTHFFQTTATTFGRLRLDSNNMPSMAVDKILVEIDSYISVSQTAGLRQLYLHGNNAAPTDGSVTGYDGLAAKASLILKGITVNTN